MADVLHSYILPGRAADARVGIAQAQAGERLGLHGIFLSERWDTKELGAVMGALSQATQRVQLVAGMTHFGTRHPLVQAGMAATLQTLIGGRFVLGFGRAMPAPARHVSMTWAQGLKRVFKFGILTCEHCGGAVKVAREHRRPSRDQKNPRSSRAAHRRRDIHI